jgi:hypothetical protein
VPIDAHSLCPCGNGKKIKFCCPDLLGELQKIERMLEGKQNLACLGHIERLQEREPDRACLLAIKGMLLRAMGQWEEAQANAATFVAKHPDNPTALVELAIATAAEQGGCAAMGPLQRALAACNGEIPSRVYEALGMVARVLLSEGQWSAGRALLQLQMAIHQDDPQPVETLVEINRMTDLPLLLKHDPIIAPCPDDVPWKVRFEDALGPVAAGNWQAGAEKLAALADEVPDSPAIWGNLATLRGWLADTAGCIDALRRFAATQIPLEEAVEAEALAMLLADSPLGDPLEILSATWTVKDVELFQAALTLESRVIEVSLDASSWADENSPPPKAAYLILNRPVLDKAEDLSPETVSRLLGQAMLFGRQTDREARLQVLGVTRADLPQLQTSLQEIADDAFDPQSVEEEVIARTSASRELIQRRWHLPRGATTGQFEMLAAAHTRDALLNRWPQLELGIFDGKSARQVAGDESCRVKLLAAVMVLQSWNESAPGEFDYNQLRSQLGLPALEPIDPSEAKIGELPLVRLSRVMVDRASDEALCLGYRRALAFGATAALGKFARAIVDRASLAGSAEQLRSYRTLVELERDPEKALPYIDEGRRAAESGGRSSAPWDLMELTVRFGCDQPDEVRRLIEHIQRCHLGEAGVAESLTRFLVSVGAISPDGTPAPLSAQEEPRMAAGAAAGAQPHRVWTPESQQSGGPKKIWTPD